MSTDNASLLVAWQLANRTVLIVGAGEVASSRLQSVLQAGATIRLVAPADQGLHPAITRALSEHADKITHHDRYFTDSDLAEDVQMVLTAIDDVAASQRIARLCREKRIPINAADIPPSCDFYFGSQIRRGPLQIMVSTNGKGPKLANLIRRRLEAALPDRVEQAIENVGELRVKLRLRAPGVGGELSQKRMKWMTKVCNVWTLDELAQLDESMADKLLDDGWEHSTVPSFASVAQRSSSTSWSLGLPASQWLVPFLAGAVAGVSCSVLYSKRR